MEKSFAKSITSSLLDDMMESQIADIEETVKDLEEIVEAKKTDKKAKKSVKKKSIVEEKESQVVEVKETKKRKKKDDKPEKVNKKEKDKKNEDEGPKEIIYNFMLAKMRPLNPQNVCDGLHNAVKKKDCNQLMDDMVEEGLLCANQASSKVYWVNQSKLGSVDPEAEAKVDKMTNDILEEKQEQEERRVELKSKMATVLDSLSTEQLVKAVEEKEKEELYLIEKLKSLETMELIDSSVMEKMKASYDEAKKRYLALSRNYRGVVADLAETMESSEKETKTNLGIDDEDLDDMRKGLLINFK